MAIIPDVWGQEISLKYNIEGVRHQEKPDNFCSSVSDPFYIDIDW